NCRNLKFTSFPKLGFRLENHTVRTIDVVNEDLCMFQCYLEPDCVSYNFCAIKQSSGKHKCDLNNATIEHDQDLVENDSCVYRGAENACKQNPCTNNATCQAGFTDRDYQCLCVNGSGFKGHDCDEDIDECFSGKHSCEGNTTCNNTFGSYSCKCKKGYQGNNKNCTDVDECLNETHGCDVNAECNNTLGSYKCTCKDGFQGNGTKCTDTNECTTGNHDCDVNAECNNTLGSYNCTFEDGYEGNGTKFTVFSDLCPGTFKYLEVKYKCVNLASNRYESIGCFKDNTTSPAIETLEGKDDILDGNYSTRNDSIDKCFRAAERQRFHIFAVQDGGRCQASASAITTFHKYNQSQQCPPGGKGGKQINHVYYIKGHKSVGCYKLDGTNRLTHELTGSDPILNGIYPAQPGSFISKCAVAKLWSVIICEGGKRTISCDNDQRTIDVVDANYGRLDSNTCHHSAVSDTNCKAANSLFIVRLKCNEEASCELHADSLVFGDPCPGTYKYLEVKYKCVNLEENHSKNSDRLIQGLTKTLKLYLIASNRYESIGCFKDDTTSPAIETLEGKDDILDGNYSTRNDSIDKCFRAAERQRFHIFAVQDGG
ncbi:hypothetical protein pdam_00000540, partial [Pocillopora damicornis]